MIEKLDEIAHRFEEVSRLIVLPETMADMKTYARLNKEYKELERVTHEYQKYKQVLKGMEDARLILATEKDADFRELAKSELEELLREKEKLESSLKTMLIPRDPNDSKNIILEIRAGTGGDEAAIFAGDLYRMYTRFAEEMGWKIQIVDYTEGTSGGFKEIVAAVAGDDVYGKLKYESGVHRVQRVPATETQGRIHTSAASVVVLPEMEEVEVSVSMNDIRKETFCSSGPGGQSVNTTYSAIRLTHIPTGIVAQCQDEKSQIKNFEKALGVLRARIYEVEKRKQEEAIGASRKSMVGTGDRSDKIRTYNYPQSRVTDHRINFTVYNLPAVMNGDIGDFIENLRIADHADKMTEGASA
jgi:peptide chain release factor 1